MIPRNSFFFVDACPSSSLIRLIVNCFFTSLLYLFSDLVAIPTRKTDDSASLLEAINQAIAELREEGKLSEISMKYFGRDITAETVGEAAE